MPTDPTPTEREMADEEVNRRLARIRYGGNLSPEGGVWITAREGLIDPPNYCSPSAPVSLRIEMVEAVEAAAAKWEKEFPASKRITRPNPWAVFFDAVDIELSSESGATKGTLRLKQGPFARGVLAALESAGRGGEK